MMVSDESLPCAPQILAPRFIKILGRRVKQDLLEWPRVLDVEGPFLHLVRPATAMTN